MDRTIIECGRTVATLWVDMDTGVVAIETKTWQQCGCYGQESWLLWLPPPLPPNLCGDEICNLVFPSNIMVMKYL